jgi:hypothetical protein
LPANAAVIVVLITAVIMAAIVAFIIVGFDLCLLPFDL